MDGSVETEGDVDIENDDSVDNVDVKMFLDGDEDEVKLNNEVLTKDLLSQITKRVKILRDQYRALNLLNKMHKCYCSTCDNKEQLNDSINCYSPTCIQRSKLRKELLVLLRKANNQNNVTGFSLNCAQEDSSSGFKKLSAVKKESDVFNDSSNSEDPFHYFGQEKPAVTTEVTSSVTVTKTQTTSSARTVRIVDGSVQSVTTSESISCSSSANKNNTIAKISCDDNGNRLNSTFSKVKTEAEAASLTVKNEFNVNGTKIEVNMEAAKGALETKKVEIKNKTNTRIYSCESTQGKLYLKRVQGMHDKKKKRIPVKYPLCSTFQTRSKKKNILVLPQHELRKLSRRGGTLYVNGFHHIAKVNYVRIFYH